MTPGSVVHSAAATGRGLGRDEVIGLEVCRTSLVSYCFPCSISFNVDETRCRVASSMNAFSKLCEAAFLVVEPSCHTCEAGLPSIAGLLKRLLDAEHVRLSCSRPLEPWQRTR